MRSAWAVSLGCVAILATLPVSTSSADSEQWQWTAPFRLAQGVEGTSYTKPSLDVEPGGIALLTWSQAEPEDHFKVYVTWHVPGDGWGQPLPMENVNGTTKHPAAALDGQGRALVAFRREAFPVGAIWATHLRPKENSGEMQILSPEGSVTVPLVAAAQSGSGVVIWVHPRQPQGLWGSLYHSTLTWGPTSRLDSDEIPAQVPRVAIDGQGNALVTWSSSRVLYATHTFTGLGWSQPAAVATSEEGWVGEHRLAMGSNGQGVVVWRESERVGYGEDIRARWFDPETGWRAPETVVTDVSLHARPSVAVSPSGHAIVAWDQNTEIWASHFVPGEGWGERAFVGGDSGTGNRSAGPVTIATGPRDSFLAVWHQVVDDRWSVWTCQFDPEVGWDTPEILSSWMGAPRPSQRPIVGLPQGTVDGQGISTVAWIRRDGPDHGVWLSQFGPTGDEGDANPMLLLVSGVAAAGVISVAALYFYFRKKWEKEGKGKP